MNKLTPKTIITSHLNADFDALASMVAASKLYPDATLVAPTFLERQDSHIFSDSIAYLFNLVQPKDCDFSEVSLLVVTDTRHRSRIAHVEAVFDNPGLVIHSYDHHPDSAADIPAQLSDIRPWGSCTAILIDIMKGRGIAPTQEEATMMALGIYEDTGSFTFTSTTTHDLLAAAYLLPFGVDLATISELTSADLTRQQVHMLDTLLKASVTHTIHGIPVTITEIVLDDFLGDFASIVDKLMDMEKLKVIFCLAYMDDRIHMIARSNIPEVDAGKICASFGGGGHGFAASASIKQRTLAEIRGEVLALLVSTIRPKMTVGTQMTSPAKTITSLTSIARAEEIMNRYGLKAIPILNPQTEECVGILELQTANRANIHRLGNLPVSEYMQRKIKTLGPDEDLYKAVEIIVNDRQRLIPIIKDNNVLGVLTRTDILRLFIDDSLHITESLPQTQEHVERQIADIIRSSLPEWIQELLHEAGNLATARNVQVFVVGGFVRDLLLGHPNLDIDLSVEGDGIAFAEALAERFGGYTRQHQKFKTAIVFYTDKNGKKQHLDVATARLEYYESPGALPTVELSSIKMDLYRRDFTINALAIQLNNDRFGTLIDPFGGQRDIKGKRISVMHSLSFIEDPTRILRAIRFEQRFDFEVSSQTERLIKNAMSLDMIGRVSGSRLFHEMSHVFDEKKVTACLKRMDDWKILHSIHPRFQLTPTREKLCLSIEDVLSWYKLLYKNTPPRNWVLFMLALTSGIKYTEVEEILTRLAFIEKNRKEFMHIRGNSHNASNKLIYRAKRNEESLSSLYTILSPLSLEGQLFLLAKHGQEHNIGQDISAFLTKLKDFKTDINGQDLLDMGYPAGPDLGQVLKRVLLEKMDGKAIRPEEQLAFAAKLLEEGFDENK